jgi:hypothetical protein
MTPDTTVDWANGGAPSVYTNRLELSQAWCDALFGARAPRRDVSGAQTGAVRREAAREKRPDGRNGLAFERSHATTIARAAARVKVEAMNRSALRSSRSAPRPTRISAAPRAPGFRIVVLRGSGGLAVAIAYTERGLSIAARRAGPAAKLALERAREALVAQGIVHRSFTSVPASIGATP